MAGSKALIVKSKLAFFNKNTFIKYVSFKIATTLRYIPSESLVEFSIVQ